METLIHVILVGFAVGYVTELVSELLDIYIEPKMFKQIATVPLAIGGLILLGNLDWGLVVTAPAAGFVALSMMRIVNRPVILQNVAQRRA